MSRSLSSTRRMRAVVLGATLIAFAMATSAQDLPGRLPRPRLPVPGAEPSGGQNLVKVTGTADVQRVLPGQTFRLAFIFEIEPQWHIYWKNSGASGGPTEVQVTAPAGFVVGRTLYPRPQIFHGEEGATYGYEKKTVLFVEVTAPEMLLTSQVNFNARANWMVCKDVCLLGQTSLMVSVMTGERAPLSPATTEASSDAVVAEYRKRLPKPLSELPSATATFADGVLTISLPAGAHESAEFFPVEAPGVTYDQASIKKENDRLVITVPVNVNAGDSLGQPMRIIATVGMGTQPSDPAYDIEIPVQEGSKSERH